MLKPGQIIRYGPALYRVDFVNTSRAFIIPLTKTQLKNGATGGATDGGTGSSISPNSLVEIITDLDRARDEMELASVESELAAAKAELARREKEPVTTVTPARIEPKKPVPHHREPIKPGGGWFLKPDVATPGFKEGTLAEAVYLFIGLNPGLPTPAIVAGVKIGGAVAACVSRFHQAGLIEKR